MGTERTENRELKTKRLQYENISLFSVLSLIISSMMNFLKNYLSTLIFIGAGYVFYTTNGYYVPLFSGINSISWLSISASSVEIFRWTIGIYTIALIPYYLVRPTSSKARILFSWIFSRPVQPIDREKKLAILSL